jgi:hypothetical protein
MTTERGKPFGCRATPNRLKARCDHGDSTTAATVHKDFPLSFRSGENRWCKKVAGKMFHFAGTADEALAEWLRCKDYILLHGRKPPTDSPEGLTTEDLCDYFPMSSGPWWHQARLPNGLTMTTSPPASAGNVLLQPSTRGMYRAR